MYNIQKLNLKNRVADAHKHIMSIKHIPIQGVYKRMVQFQKFIKQFHRNVQELLNRVLQQRWIGRAANGDNHIHILYGTNSIIVWMCVM
jgi:hypothetical protein